MSNVFFSAKPTSPSFGNVLESPNVPGPPGESPSKSSSKKVGIFREKKRKQHDPTTPHTVTHNHEHNSTALRSWRAPGQSHNHDILKRRMRGRGDRFNLRPAVWVFPKPRLFLPSQPSVGRRGPGQTFGTVCMRGGGWAARRMADIHSYQSSNTTAEKKKNKT